MGFKPTFSKGDVQGFLQARVDAIHTAILNRLIWIGETFTTNARISGNYKDWTSNLRSSIGYLVVHNGVVLSEGFQQAGMGTGGEAGVNQARAFAKEVASRFSAGFVLVVVAGMEYAAAVESKGRDALTASSITAKHDLEKAIAEIKHKMAS